MEELKQYFWYSSSGVDLVFININIVLCWVCPGLGAACWGQSAHAQCRCLTEAAASLNTADPALSTLSQSEVSWCWRVLSGCDTCCPSVTQTQPSQPHSSPVVSPHSQSLQWSFLFCQNYCSKKIIINLIAYLLEQLIF